MRVRTVGFTLFSLLLLACVGYLSLAGASPSGEIASQFSSYYWRYHGQRTLGYVESTPLQTPDGMVVQYFEKGRLEDHQGLAADQSWKLMFGRLTVELIERAPELSIDGLPLTYGELAQYAERLPAPSALAHGTLAQPGGTFVPFNTALTPEPGYVVGEAFWRYMNRPDLFPGGWLHDIGLPLTRAFEVSAQKGDQPRTITVQAFERAILTYDPQNPAEWQVERANLGTAMLQTLGLSPLHAQPDLNKRIVVDLTLQHMYAYEGERIVLDAPVSTGRDGFQTPTGEFAIYAKYERKTMRGSAKGEKWVVPNVPHAMFFNGGVALHGTYWHNKFGTGARLSHGCVNLPLEAAAWLFDWAPVGTPVIVIRS